jgi:hypothetical protein
MLKMLVDATGKSTPNTLGQELKTIIHQDTADLTKHTAWQYVEEAKKFIENL